MINMVQVFPNGHPFTGYLNLSFVAQWDALLIYVDDWNTQEKCSSLSKTAYFTGDLMNKLFCFIL